LVGILTADRRGLSQRQRGVLQTTAAQAAAFEAALRSVLSSGRKLRIFNTFGEPAAVCRRSQPAAVGGRSFNGLPGRMNVHVTTKPVAVDIVREAE
jgi:hypothetical protein